MPNHITSVVTVTGPDENVRRFIATAIRPIPDAKDFKLTFDIEAIIPMPQSIKNTIRDIGDAGDGDVELYAQALITNRRHFIVDRYPWLPDEVRRWGDLIEWYDRERPTVRQWARNALIAAGETGYPGWYEWSYANWGTKWNAYQYRERSREPGRFVFQFQTANGVPVHIFRKVADMWPTLTFDTESIDEGGWEYAGSFHGTQCQHAEMPKSDERYVRVYGHARYVEEDEEPADGEQPST